jgi:hypothetical protein
MSPSMQALVASYGYVGSVSTIYRPTSPGWRLVVHFDDRLTVAPDGRAQLAVRVAAEIGAPECADSKAMHLTLQKTALRQASHEWIWLGLEIDVIAPHGMNADRLRAHPRLFGRLRSLLEDVLTMLDALPDSNAAPPGPKLRLEARLLGDLLVCRNGFVSGKGEDTHTHSRAAARSACTWMAYILLPEFAAMLRLEDSASQTPATNRKRDHASLSKTNEGRDRNIPVANHAQMKAHAPLKSVRAKALKPMREGDGETTAQVDPSLPDSKSLKRSGPRVARGAATNEAPVVTDEISAADTATAVEVTTLGGVVNSLRPARRKASRLAARPRALLHT